MKSLTQMRTQLELLKPVLREQFGVETISLFGSYSRGEQTQKSNIDVLV